MKIENITQNIYQSKTSDSGRTAPEFSITSSYKDQNGMYAFL